MKPAAARSARSALALLAVAVCAAPLAAEHWQVQYLYDETKSGMEIVDLQFPSPSHGVAVALIEKGKSRNPVALTTSDGGAHWQTVPLKDEPLAVYFLNENNGWMVGDKSLWKTGDAGRTWAKLPAPPFPLNRVYFLTEKDGWALCAERALGDGKKRPLVLETHDGAQTWKPLAVANAPADALYAAYRFISFASPTEGIIVGYADPPQPPRGPDWLEPASALARTETARTGFNLQPLDGGQTWQAHGNSGFGEITRARFSPHGKGLGLIEHLPSFAYPSEVFAIEWPSGGNAVVYRDKSFFVSDIWVAPDGAYYLAGVVLTSRLRDVIPQKVKVLTSRDLKQWTPMDVDYRAAANRVVLAGAGAQDLWLATNNGMILKLVP